MAAPPERGGLSGEEIPLIGGELWLWHGYDVIKVLYQDETI